MLAQHLITRPVFDALFENYSLAQNNAVSKSMQKIFALLDTADDSEQLEKFYQSVREWCRIATTAEDKQKIIIELYDKFFRTALPLTVERLGIERLAQEFRQRIQRNLRVQPARRPFRRVNSACARKKFDGAAKSFFAAYSLDISTNRDAWFYNFSLDKFISLQFLNLNEALH